MKHKLSPRRPPAFLPGITMPLGMYDYDTAEFISTRQPI